MPEQDTNSADQPLPGSRLRVTQQEEGLVIDVPPTGPFQWIAGFWLFFALVFSPAPVWAIGCYVGSFRAGFKASDVGPALLITPFIIAGILFWLIAIHWMIRRTTIMVTDEWLGVVCKGVLPRRRRLWHRTALAAVSVGNSNVAVNNAFIPELQIRPRKARLFHLLAGLRPADLEWLAELLNRELRLSELPPELPETPVAPANATASPQRPKHLLRHFLFDYGGIAHQMVVNSVLAVILWAFWCVFFAGRVFWVHLLPWWLAVGAGSGVIFGIVYVLWHLREVAALANVAANLDFSFQADVEQTALGDFQELPLLSHWCEGHNLMAGKLDGIPVWMLDYRYTLGAGQTTTWYNQTIVLLQGPPKFPAFFCGQRASRVGLSGPSSARRTSPSGPRPMPPRPSARPSSISHRGIS